MKRIGILITLALIILVAVIVSLSSHDSPHEFAASEEHGDNAESAARQSEVETNSESLQREIVSRSSAKAVEPIRGPLHTGMVTLKDRIDRFVPHFEGGAADGVVFEVDLLGEKFSVALTEFERVPGDPGSGVFFGYVEGEPHSRVSWAFHGEAEVGEIQVHGQDTLKILPTGNGREHRVQAWNPIELKRCAICLAQEE